MKVEHQTTIILSSERERTHLRDALLIANELCQDAVRHEACAAVLMRNGVEDAHKAARLGDYLTAALDAI